MKLFLQKETKVTKKGTVNGAFLRFLRINSRPSLSSFPSVNFLLLLFTGILSAEPGTKLIVPKSEAWTGQRLPLFVELRAEGTFSGAASFDLPEIPKTVILKIGSPIISSKTEGDTEFFIQRHEFALFSQADGTLNLPPITARFSHKKGYSGPSFDTSSKTEATKLSLKRPPDSRSLGFIVTTGSLEIEESWDPAPGPLETGAVLKRTIVQRATQLTGIALKPAPTPEIDGIRTYSGTPEVTDKTQRGEFLGERRETVTYLVQQPGLHRLPEISYSWWDPATETLESRTLPSVSFTATAPPIPPEKPSPSRYLWFLLPAALLGIAIFNHSEVTAALGRIRVWIDPPPKRAARHFLRACDSNDPREAIRTWDELRRLRPALSLEKELEAQIKALYAQLFGPRGEPQAWSGKPLASAFRRLHKTHQPSPHPNHLPQINP